MTRLIDADAVIFKIWETTIQPEWCKVLTDKVIRDQPTVDAVPVVRCCDCKYYAGDTKGCIHDDAMIIAPASGFCSYGERKEE